MSHTAEIWVIADGETSRFLSQAIPSAELHAPDAIETLTNLPEDERPRVVVIDAASESRAWSALEILDHSSCGPSAIVVLPDGAPERWAEALNRGAFDALMQPLSVEDLRESVARGESNFLRRKEVLNARRSNPRYVAR